jgi:tetratricopeptide (TPR) repeat protein
MIETLRGVGFRFVADAREAAAADAGTPPAPARSGFVGRESELALLRSALGRASAAGGGLVLLVGEPGIGKTRLAEMLLAEAQHAGMDVREAYNREDPGVPAFWLWAQVLRGYAGAWDPGTLRSALGPGALELGRIAPELRELLQLELPESADHEETRFRLFDALGGFLERASRIRPQAILLDDLQWADADSIAALTFLARALRRERVLFVATARTVEADRSQPFQDLVVEYAKCDALLRVALGGLTRSEVGLLVEAQTGVRPPDEIVALLHRKAGGNPFFVSQVLALAPIVANGAGGRPTGAALDGLALPAGMQRVASKRLAGLGATCREALEVAAVAGTEFSFALVAQAHGGDRRGLLEALDEGAERGIVARTEADSSRWRFLHDLLRQVLCAELLGPQRATLHGRVAEALETLHAGHLAPVVPALAHHYGEAAPLLGADRAVHYAKWAGDLTRQAAAYAEAVAQYERALRALALGPPAPRRRAELLVCLAHALQSAGRNARAREVYAEAAALARSEADAPLLAFSALGFADFFMLMGDPEAIALLEEALSLQGPEHSRLRSRLQSALAVQLAGIPERQEEAARLAAEAEDSARSLGSGRCLAAALLAQSSLERMRPGGRPSRRRALATDAASAIRGRGETTFEVMASLARHGALLEMGDLAAADAELARLEKGVRRLHSPHWRNVVPFLHAGRAMLEGRFDEAVPLGEAAFGSPELYDTPELNYRAPLRLAVAYERGQSEELLAQSDLLAELYADSLPARAVRVIGLAETGRADEERSELEAMAEEGLAEIPGTPEWMLSLGILSEACADLGHAEIARRVHALLEPRAEDWIVAGSGRYLFGPVALHLGTLALTFGDLDTAERHLEAALERVDTMRSPPWRAHVLAALALVCEQRATAAARRRAKILAREATAIAEDLGMARVLRKLARVGQAACP